MSEPHRDRSEKTVPILTVLIIVIAALGVGGTLMGFTQARRAREMAEMERAMAQESRARAMEAEALARAQRQRAQAISDLVQQALSTADPADASKEISVRDALAAAAKRLEDGNLDPASAANLHSKLGSAYAAQGDLAAAEKHLRAALELRKKALGDNAPQVATDQENLDKLLQQRAK